MQIKRFFGSDAKSLIKQIRDTLGEDAMILSNRQLDNGVEILCGVEGNNDTATLDLLPEVHLTTPAPTLSADRSLNQLSQELHALRDLLEDQLADFAWNDLQLKKPVHAILMKRLIQSGFSASQSKNLAMQADDLGDIETTWHALQKKLSTLIAVSPSDIINTSKIIALIGPSSSGKTMSIIKLAARYALSHTTKNIVIITTDTHRVGAYETLKIYSNILGLSLRIIEPNQSLSSVFDTLQDDALILIDTPSCAKKRLYVLEELKEAMANGFSIKKLVVLSALQQRSFLNHYLAQIRHYGIDGCIVTHLDEVINLGEIIGFLIENKLPIYYTSHGEQVPEDIHLPDSHALLKKCWESLSKKETSVNKESIAIKLLTEVV